MVYFKYLFFLFLVTLQFGCAEAPPTSIAIIGGGASGIMALKRAVIENHTVLFFTGTKDDEKKSRGNWAKDVANIPGLEKYHNTIPELRRDVLKSVSQGKFKKNLRVINDSIKNIEKEDGIFIIRDLSGNLYKAQFVILATGVQGEHPYIAGTPYKMMEYAKKENVSHCILCDGHKSVGKEVTVIGHTESSASTAIKLSKQYNPKRVTILTNGLKANFSENVKKVLEERNITVIQSKIEDILGKEKLKAFQVQGKKIYSEMTYLSLGMRPNNQLALQLGAKVDKKGFVEVDVANESSIENLFVVGDLCNNGTKQIHTAWQHAVNAVNAISNYEPPISETGCRL